ncbi:MAG: hypothetical protein ABIK98_03820, partial [Pseudomonadota bacterium]
LMYRNLFRLMVFGFRDDNIQNTVFVFSVNGAGIHFDRQRKGSLEFSERPFTTMIRILFDFLFG